ncbi:MAG: hypothetical protein ACKOA1_04110, partial [Bacteroidota bacterium]
MKATHLFFLCLLSAVVYGQKNKAETPYLAYFNQKPDSLDPIEGIWNVSSVQEFYRYDTLYDVLNYSKAGRFAIMKKDGKYQSLDLSGGDYQV